MSREVPEGWKFAALSDMADIFLGQSPSSSETNEQEIGLPFFQGNGEFGDRYPTPRRWVLTGPRLADEGDILISVRAPVGELNVAPGRCVIGRGLGAVRARNVDSSFLWHALHFSAPQLHSVSQGSTFDAVNRGELSKLTLPSPPIHEQRRIAEILSSVDGAIAATRAVIEQTRKIKQGMLERLLTKGIRHTRFKQTEIGEIPEGWELKRLRDLAIHITSGSRGWAQYYSEEGELFLRSQNVRNGSLDLSDKQFVTVPKSAEGSRTLVQADDLVFTITGNSVGNIARIPADLGDAYVSQHVALVRLRDRQLSAFLEAFFSPSGPGNHQILNAQYGQSKPGLSLENVRSFHVPVPPHQELAQLSEIVKDHSDYEMNVATELSHLISLKSALMSDLLTGRKRVVDALPMAAE
ncbi:restriction endonuclease subunit S [Agrobacterium tumefaciens]|uniref:restriction endonuclease subunit S n=1 Tax=Agrobacterium tumefaciens TaxID=358 RepID=UPI001573F7FE|nr:restriction endonuclease subunit S [Agrobacterium tumefaciens]NTE56097.1 restriction endonuclease subunit S [Agrobacterium tumefaciens]NTE74193.1 restriction endonuclease subunit S [Agrobacterium tumefaciens]